MTELETRAAEAWRLVIRRKTLTDMVAGTEPMPLNVALDYVHEVADNPTAAFGALCLVASKWLIREMPQPEDNEFFRYRDCAVRAAYAIREGYFRPTLVSFELIASYLMQLNRYIADMLDPRERRAGGMMAAEVWRQWRVKADNVVEKLIALESLSRGEHNG